MSGKLSSLLWWCVYMCLGKCVTANLSMSVCLRVIVWGPFLESRRETCVPQSFICIPEGSLPPRRANPISFNRRLLRMADFISIHTCTHYTFTHTHSFFALPFPHFALSPTPFLLQHLVFSFLSLRSSLPSSLNLPLPSSCKSFALVPPESYLHWAIQLRE